MIFSTLNCSTPISLHLKLTFQVISLQFSVIKTLFFLFKTQNFSTFFFIKSTTQKFPFRFPSINCDGTVANGKLEKIFNVELHFLSNSLSFSQISLLSHEVHVKI